MVRRLYVRFLMVCNMIWKYFLAIKFFNLVFLAVAGKLLFVNLESVLVSASIRHTGNKYHEHYHSNMNAYKTQDPNLFSEMPVSQLDDILAVNNYTTQENEKLLNLLVASKKRKVGMKYVGQQITTKPPLLPISNHSEFLNDGEEEYDPVGSVFEQNDENVADVLMMDDSKSSKSVVKYHSPYVTSTTTSSYSIKTSMPVWFSTSSPSSTPNPDNIDEDTKMILAHKHYHRMKQETACRKPKPKVMKISDVYPSPHKTYFPSCTIIHQCSEDSGCCGGDVNKQCTPEKVANVTLFFIVTQLENSKLKRSYEALSFFNHTECRCRTTIENSMPRDSTNVSFDSNPTVDVTKEDQNAVQTTDPQCVCPSGYTIRYIEQKKCICDCFDQQRECIRYKRGNRYFEYLDRFCITSGKCLPPSCYYGEYSVKFGRCPTRRENIDNS